MDTLPWYRQPWPWFLIALPAVAVVASTATAVLAVRSNDGVVADYYQRGLAINDELARSARAVELGLTVDVAAAGLRAGDRVALRIVARQPLPLDATVRLALMQSGRAGAEIVLARTMRADDGLAANFVGVWREDVVGSADSAPWQWVVESADWRVDGDAGRLAATSTFTAQAAAR